MNRRSFISLALLSPFIRAIKPKDLFFDEIKLKGAPVFANQCWSKERIDYVTMSAFYGNLTFNNPRALGVITNIGSE